MTENVKCVYLICSCIHSIAVLFAAILKPEWWGAFLILGILASLSLGVRIQQWDKEGK